MDFAVGEWVEVEHKRVSTVFERRVEVGQDCSVGSEERAVPMNIHRNASAHSSLHAAEAPNFDDSMSAGSGSKEVGTVYGEADSVGKAEEIVVDVVGKQGAQIVDTMAVSTEAVDYFGVGPIVEHTDEVDVHTTGVGKMVDEEVSRADVVDPYPDARPSALGNEALDGATGDDKFFEEAAV